MKRSITYFGKKLYIFVLLTACPFLVKAQFVVVEFNFPLMVLLPLKEKKYKELERLQPIINIGFQQIRLREKNIRIKQYESRTFDKNLRARAAAMALPHNVLLGAPILMEDNFPMYMTAAKNVYFTRELATLNTTLGEMALVGGGDFTNGNRQELYFQHKKMLQKLKEGLKPPRDTALLTVIASILAGMSEPSDEERNSILTMQ